MKSFLHSLIWVRAVRWLRAVTPAHPRRFSHHLPSCAEFVDTGGNVVQYATLWYWGWLVTSTTDP